MLDLDSLAERQAKILNQKEEPWREVIWSPEFQKISASMSDGEVEILVSLCPTVAHLRAVIDYLVQHAQSQKQSPFNILTDEAAKAGVRPGDWVRSRVNS